MKKPITRVTLLEDVLSDFLQVEGILTKLQILGGASAHRKTDAVIQSNCSKGE
jgi:hypothetical protein